MGTEIIHQITEEEWEYKRRIAELNKLEVQLSQHELELATFHGEIHSFRARYLAVVGSRYWELDNLEAEIAEAEARRKPYEQAAQEKARKARTQADESAKTAGNQREVKKAIPKFKPTESLKKLYRQIAKHIHPDLATDDQERSRYQKLMAKANHAYQIGDEIGLQNILRQWKKNPGLEKNDNVSDKLARIMRQITQVKERLSTIKMEIAQIQKSSLYQLRLKVEAADADGSDLLAEMARLLDEQIMIAKANLARNKAKGNETIAS